MCIFYDTIDKRQIKSFKINTGNMLTKYVWRVRILCLRVRSTLEFRLYFRVRLGSVFYKLGSAFELEPNRSNTTSNLYLFSDMTSDHIWTTIIENWKCTMTLITIYSSRRVSCLNSTRVFYFTVLLECRSVVSNKYSNLLFFGRTENEDF